MDKKIKGSIFNWTIYHFNVKEKMGSHKACVCKKKKRVVEINWKSVSF